MGEENKLFISNKNNWSGDNLKWNAGGIFLSLAFYGTLVGLLSAKITDFDKSGVKYYAITLSIFVFIGAVLAFFNYNMFINTSSTPETVNKFFSFIALCLFSIPYILFDILISIGNNVVGKRNEESLNNMSLDKLGKEYSGGFTRFEGNLGKRDSGFTILGKIRMSKREGILPCNPYKGVCKVRRSVIYMIFYLSAVILIPLFKTLSNMSGDDKSFDLDIFLGYVSAFLAATLGIVLVFVLSTVSDAADSDVFAGSTVEQKIREKREVPVPGT